MYVVTYTGKFGFIKPWTAVRDGETSDKVFLLFLLTERSNRTLLELK